MTEKTKAVNYTAEQVAEMVEAYTATPTKETVKVLAEKFGKTERSVIAKLAKEKVYQSEAKEAGKRAMLKSEMVAKLAELTGASEEQLDSLEKATGTALMVLVKALTAAKAAEWATRGSRNLDLTLEVF